MADESVIEPSRERRRHGRVERYATTIQDVDGDIARPWRAFDTLSKMQARGAISATMLAAGNHFRDTFRRAGFDTLQGSDPRRLPVLTVDNSQTWSVRRSSDAAIELIRDSIEALGSLSSPCGSCAWHVLGLEETLQEWARRQRWGANLGMDRAAAGGVLVGALGILELHYGFKAPR